MPVTTRFNLALVYRPGVIDPADYQSIAHEIRKLSGGIDIHIVPDYPGLQYDPGIASHPLLTFSPVELSNFKPPRGRVFSGRRIEKSEQMLRLARAGIRVPKWTYLQPNKSYSEAEWGRFVILKPNAWGAASKGRGIELVRTASLAYKPRILFSKEHPGRAGSMLVQKFIDTGPHSEDYRVMTLFGRPLYALRRKSLVKIEDLDATGGDRTSRGVVSNAEGGPRETDLCYDKAVLDFAATTYRAVPEVPLHAVDVRREKGTGRLYCLEINPGGNTWNFSSARAVAIPTIGGIRREDQFGAWKIAAEALIEKTLQFAS